MEKSFLLALAMVLIGCREKVVETTVQVETPKELAVANWPRAVAIVPEAWKILEGWPEFMAMQSSFETVYSAQNEEDLALVIDDLIEKQKLLEQSAYPPEFDIPQVRSRQKLFKTFFLKAKGQLNLDQDPDGSVKEMIDAYNAFRNQFNVTVQGKLDDKLLKLDDEEANFTE